MAKNSAILKTYGWTSERRLTAIAFKHNTHILFSFLVAYTLFTFTHVGALIFFLLRLVRCIHFEILLSSTLEAIVRNALER